jgi:hypothetical protein
MGPSVNIVNVVNVVQRTRLELQTGAPNAWVHDNLTAGQATRTDCQERKGAQSNSPIRTNDNYGRSSRWAVVRRNYGCLNAGAGVVPTIVPMRRFAAWIRGERLVPNGEKVNPISWRFELKSQRLGRLQRRFRSHPKTIGPLILLAEMHPGRTILEDIVKPRNMSVNALAKEFHISAPRA